MIFFGAFGLFGVTFWYSFQVIFVFWIHLSLEHDIVQSLFIWQNSNHVILFSDSNREYEPAPARSKLNALDFDTLLRQAQQQLKR